MEGEEGWRFGILVPRFGIWFWHGGETEQTELGKSGMLKKTNNQSWSDFRRE